MRDRLTIDPQTVMWSVAFVLFAPAICHWLFSWMGFNPTDNGFFLALSSHILDGQVPHRDFISIHPIGSALLHLPTVILGGGSTLWISRGVLWVEFAIIAVIWIWILVSVRGKSVPWWEQFCSAFIVFAVSVHSFPVLVWNTVDGLLFVSVGLLFILRRGAVVRTIGWFILGCAYLFKASFVLMVPLALLITTEWRTSKRWTAAFLPGIAYILFLVIIGALGDALSQMTSSTDLFHTGVWHYIRRWAPVGLIIGYSAARVLHRSELDPTEAANRRWRYRLAVVGLYGVPIVGGVWGLWIAYVDRCSVVLFGILAGVVLHSILINHRTLTAYARIVLLILATGWCVSLSLGYNWPALMAGPMLLALLWWPTTTATQWRTWLRRPAVVVALTVFICVAFGVGRRHAIYRERSVDSLTYSIADVLSAGRHIRTNENTHAMLAELQSMQRDAQASGHPCAIIPGVSAAWIGRGLSNPLPMDWIHPVAAANPDIRERILGVLDEWQDSLAVIVQTADPRHLAWRTEPLETGDLEDILQFVADHYEVSQTGKYHTMYGPRSPHLQWSVSPLPNCGNKSVGESLINQVGGSW